MIGHGTKVADINPSAALRTTDVIVYRNSRRRAEPLIEVLASEIRPHRKASFTLCIAGCSGFFTFTQLGETPARYCRSLRFDTNPSRPIKQACRNRSGPISPLSKSD